MIAVPARSELGLQREMELIAPAVAVDWQSASRQQGASLRRGSFIKKLGISLIRRSFLQLVAGQKTHLLALVPEGIHLLEERCGGPWQSLVCQPRLPRGAEKGSQDSSWDVLQEKAGLM